MSVIKLEPGYIIPVHDINVDEILFVDAAQLEDTLALADIVIDIPTEPESKKASEDISKAEDIQTYINEVLAYPEENGEPQREGFTGLYKTNVQSFPLHVAARSNDVERTIELLENGEDIHKEDHRSAQAIHVAALFGSTDVLKVLIDYGANLHDSALGSQTPLAIALNNNQYEAAKTIIEAKQLDTMVTNIGGSNVLGSLLDHIEAGITPDSKITKEQLFQAIEAFEVAIQESSYAYITKGDLVYPVSMILTVLNTYTNDEEIHEKIEHLVQAAEQHDPTAQSFVRTLDLLHHFPTGGVYELNLSKSHKMTQASEGHFGSFTTDLAAKSLHAYTESLKAAHADPMKIAVFEDLTEIYEHGSDLANHRIDDSYIDAAIERYDEGETILLPSGWHGHFINVIINKDLGLYITANSGQRYHGELTQDTPADPAGLIFHRMEDPEKIDHAFIKGVLNNTQKDVLEFDLQHEYGLTDRVYEIELANQQFGNCGWESHRNAIQGLIFYKLVENKVAHDDAKILAKDYFNAWDDAHGHFVIDRFIESNPKVEVGAIVDILDSITRQHDGKKTGHGEKLSDLLKSDLYAEKYKGWVDSHAQDYSEEALSTLHKVYGLEVTPSPQMMQEVTVSDPSPGIAFESNIPSPPTYHAQPHFNIAHVMMTESFFHESPLIF